MEYFNHTGVVSSLTEILKFEAPLNSYDKPAPTRPSGMDEAYLFKGWYKDSAGTVPFVFTQTMPANNLVLYAKWALDPVEGTIHLAVSGGGVETISDIPYGTTIAPGQLPTVKDIEGNIVFSGSPTETIYMPANHEWVGWSSKVGDTYIIFNFDQKLYSNFELYPYSRSTARFGLVYDLNTGVGTAPEYNRKLAPVASAELKSGDGFTPPEG